MRLSTKGCTLSEWNELKRKRNAHNPIVSRVRRVNWSTMSNGPLVCSQCMSICVSVSTIIGCIFFSDRGPNAGSRMRCAIAHDSSSSSAVNRPPPSTSRRSIIGRCACFLKRVSSHSTLTILKDPATANAWPKILSS